MSAPPLSATDPDVRDPSDDAPLPGRAVERLRPYLDAAVPENPEPLALIDVLAGGRPAAWIHRPSELGRGAFAAMLDGLGIHRRRPPRGPGFVLAADPERFERLPPAGTTDDDFDRRMGAFLGYPDDAVEGYVGSSAPTTRRGVEFVARGEVAPAAFAYAKLVPWVRPLSAAAVTRQIAAGKRIADRLLAVNARCGARAIASAVAGVYHAERRRLAEKRAGSRVGRGGFTFLGEEARGTTLPAEPPTIG